MSVLERVAQAVEPLIPEECFQKAEADRVALEIARAALLAIRELGDTDLDVGCGCISWHPAVSEAQYEQMRDAVRYIIDGILRKP